MSNISNMMYHTNKDLENGSKRFEQAYDATSTRSKISSRISAIPAALVQVALCTGASTVVRIVQLANHLFSFAFNLLKTVCTLGLHAESKKNLVRSFAYTGVSIFQVVKKPFEALAIIAGGVVGVFSPRHQLQLRTAMYGFDAGIDGLIADEETVKSWALKNQQPD
ncbi:hypothetical protein JYU14_05240 [Simkania negevensis]|uniref:Uncharacterized protein n=1 Tax=Simkania negevensis TaxID=83561 RepID=A0ABS3ASW2_9BACT|nr:hypothetical protein [Simkania negevensis]